jgi:hypothetical protein
MSEKQVIGSVSDLQIEYDLLCEAEVCYFLKNKKKKKKL